MNNLFTDDPDYALNKAGVLVLSEQYYQFNLPEHGNKRRVSEMRALFRQGDQSISRDTHNQTSKRPNSGRHAAKKALTSQSLHRHLN